MKIRLATPQDAPALAQTHVITWQEAYMGLLPDSVLNNLSIERRLRWWEQQLVKEAEPNTAAAIGRTHIALVNADLVGFCHYGPTRDDDAKYITGEIYAIYLRSAHWGKGYGYQLMQKGLEGLQAAGFQAVTLWVLDSNERTKRFYERVGFTPEETVKTQTLGDTPIIERRFRYLFEGR